MNIADDAIRLIKAESERSGVSQSAIHAPGRRCCSAEPRHRVWFELADLGYHDREIAEAFGRCESAVRKARWLMGWARRSRGIA